MSSEEATFPSTTTTPTNASSTTVVGLEINNLEELLERLKEHFEKRRIERKLDEQLYVSLKEQREVTVQLQLLCSWGVFPCLERGVGLPESRRTNLVVGPSVSAGSRSLRSNKSSTAKKRNPQQLWNCVQLLLLPLLDDAFQASWERSLVLNYFLVDFAF